MKTMAVSNIPLTNLLVRLKATPVNQSFNWGVYSFARGLIMVEWDNQLNKWIYKRECR